MREPSHTDDPTRFGTETPAGAQAVDDELTAWEELLTANSAEEEMEQARDRWNVDDRPHATDMESIRERWRENPENAPPGAAENLRRAYDSRFTYDPNAAKNAGVIRTVAGALDPRTFNSKLRWAGVIVVLLLGIIIPFGIGAGIAHLAGAPTVLAAVAGIAATVYYWVKY